MGNVNPEMLVLAREARQLTQAAVAEAAGITQGALSKFESGQLEPEPATLARLASELGYPQEFFFETMPTQELPFFFRKPVSLPARAVRMVRAKMNVLRLWVSRLSLAADLPELDVPSVDLEAEDLTPEDAAQVVRSYWGVPRGPIESVVELLERAGVLVFEQDFGAAKLDGISVFERNTGLPPTVFVNPDRPGDRQRFTLAHELGHLVMHAGREHTLSKRDVEDEADRFAGELLLPARDIKGHLSTVSLPVLARLKAHWKVSMGALLMAAAKHSKVSPSQSRRLWTQMNALGYRTREPNPIERERPRLFAELVDLHLRDLGYSESELAAHLRLEEPELRLVAGLKRGGLQVVK